MRLLFIINPASGANNKNWESIVRDWFGGKEHVLAFHTIDTSTDNEPAILQQIKDFAPERIVAAGGDGTIKMMAGLLKQEHITTPLAILPTGSANGMATELGIPSNINDALELVVSGDARPLDLVCVNGEWCIHLSDMGWNATILRHFEQIPQRGMLGYARALFKMIGTRIYMPLTIRADGRLLQRKALMIVVANAARYGTGAVINPQGKPDDGVFELVIVRRMAFRELISMMITRKPFDPSAIEIISCRNAKIEAKKAYPFQVDGEYLGKQKRISAEIHPASVMVVRP